MAWIGLAPVLAGMAAIVWKSKRYKTIKLLYVALVVVLQLASYAAYSILLSGGILFPWIVIGIGGGVFLAKKKKIYKVDGKAFYRPNLIFPLVFLLFIAANQAISAIFCAYLPILLYMTGITAGLPAGYLLMIFLGSREKKEKEKKGKKEKKEKKGKKGKAPAKKENEAGAVTMVALFLLIAAISAMPLTAAASSSAHGEAAPAEGEAAAEAAPPAEPTIMDILPTEINITIEEGDNTAYDEMSGGKLGTSLTFDPGSLGKSENGEAFQGGSIRYFNYYRVAPLADSKYQYGVDGSTVRIYYGFEIYTEKTTEEMIPLLEENEMAMQSSGRTVNRVTIGDMTVFRTYESSGTIKGVTYMTATKDTLFTMVYTYAPPSAPPIEQVEVFTPKEMDEASLNTLFEAWIKRTIESDEYIALYESKSAGEESAHGASGGTEKHSGEGETAEKKASPLEALTGGKNLFHMVEVKPLAAILSSIGGGLLGAGAVILFALTCLAPIDFVPPKEKDPNELFEPDKEPRIGMMRGDGKIWTKHHGWQNKEYISVQLENIDRVLRNFHHEQERAEAAGDTVLNHLASIDIDRLTELREAWGEDYKAAERKTYQAPNHAQPETAPHNENESEQEAENSAPQEGTVPPVVVAKIAQKKELPPWNYANDIGIQLDRSGLSEITKGKSKLAAMDATFQMLGRVSGESAELMSQGASLMAAPITKELLRSSGMEEALNREILLGVGKMTDAVKKVFVFDKPSVEKLPESLASLVISLDAKPAEPKGTE